MTSSVEYERDFYAWALHNAQLLYEGQLSEIDRIHIAEELESMGHRDKRELISRLIVLITHLLKWQFQPERRSKSWKNTLFEQRSQLQLILEDSPSLKYQLDERVNKAYLNALKTAMNETDLPKSTFPSDCPYTLEQLLDETFYPENLHR
jgi:hypothetical protein